MSNSTQNDEIGKMEKAIDEGFAESERDLKDKKTPLDQPTQNDWAEDCPEFGDYVYIPQKRYGCENEIYQYLVIECLKSNAYVDVPVQTPAVETPHKDIVPVVSCLCGGVGHKEVLKYRLSDIVRVEKNPRIADARREVIADLFSNQDFLNNLKWIIQDHMNRAFKDFNEDYFIPGEMRDVGVVADRTVEAFLATLREEESHG